MTSHQLSVRVGKSAQSFHDNRLQMVTAESILCLINVSGPSNEVECRTAAIMHLTHTYVNTESHVTMNYGKTPHYLTSTEVGSLTNINYVNRMK